METYRYTRYKIADYDFKISIPTLEDVFILSELMKQAGESQDERAFVMLSTLKVMLKGLKIKNRPYLLAFDKQAKVKVLTNRCTLDLMKLDKSALMELTIKISELMRDLAPKPPTAH